MRELIAVPGLLRLVIHVEDHVGAPAVGQRPQQIPVADIACGQRVATLRDVVDDRLDRSGAIAGIDEAHDQRERVGRL